MSIDLGKMAEQLEAEERKLVEAYDKAQAEFQTARRQHVAAKRALAVWRDQYQPVSRALAQGRIKAGAAGD